MNKKLKICKRTYYNIFNTKALTWEAMSKKGMPRRIMQKGQRTIRYYYVSDIIKMLEFELKIHEQYYIDRAKLEAMLLKCKKLETISKKELAEFDICDSVMTIGDQRKFHQKYYDKE